VKSSTISIRVAASVANGILDGFLSDSEEVGGGLRLEIHNRAEGFQ
jgi:hypothetical protein